MRIILRNLCVNYSVHYNYYVCGGNAPFSMADRQRSPAVRKDPWARFEAWRDAPEISRRANLRRLFPGFLWGFGAFVVLVAIEELYWKPRHPEPAADQDH